MRLAPLTKDDKRISEVLEIELAAAQHGVELMLSERSNYIAVQWIKRRSGEPGSGADVMRMVCRYADSRGLPIMLSVIDAPSLEAYYESFGFKGSPDPMFPAEVEMKRTPK
jgi:hypothetical protein